MLFSHKAKKLGTAFACIICGCGREVYPVISTAMMPTIGPEDVVFVERRQKPNSPWASISNVVLFLPSGTNGPEWMMRIVGVPGDRVINSDGQILIQGENYEIFLTKAHKQIIGWQPGTNGYVLKGDEVFVAGDNGIALDSRYWGPLKTNFLKGRIVQ